MPLDVSIETGLRRQKGGWRADFAAGVELVLAELGLEANGFSIQTLVKGHPADVGTPPGAAHLLLRWDRFDAVQDDQGNHCRVIGNYTPQDPSAGNM